MNVRLMAQAEEEMRTYLRLRRLQRQQAHDKLQFFDAQVAKQTSHTETVTLNLTQAQALTATQGDARALVGLQRHEVNITIPKALRGVLKHTLTAGSQARLARGREEALPELVKAAVEETAAYEATDESKDTNIE